ncbi:putative RNA-directed DNA polymerase [Helianthus annuus]|nr:putative RNA-directed DNA polymerase [Helianthus annuus]
MQRLLCWRFVRVYGKKPYVGLGGPSKGCKVHWYLWVFRTKFNEMGKIYKACLVANGYRQEYGIDYIKVYTPLAIMDIIHIMIAMAAQRGWDILQIDDKSAFLYGTLEKDVYLQQPNGHATKGSENKVYKLRKALYGLKQAYPGPGSVASSHILYQGRIHEKRK